MLNKDRHQQTDNLLRNLLEDYPTPPPAGIWERVFAIVHGKPFPFINWTRVSFYLAGITVVSIFSYYALSKISSVNREEKQAAITTEITANESVTKPAVMQSHPNLPESNDGSKHAAVYTSGVQHTTDGINENPALQETGEKEVPGKPEINSPQDNNRRGAEDKTMVSVKQNHPKQHSAASNDEDNSATGQVIFATDENSPALPGENPSLPEPVLFAANNEKEKPGEEELTTREERTWQLGKIPLINPFCIPRRALLDIETETQKSDLSIAKDPNVKDDKYIPNHKMGNYNGFNVGVTYIGNMTGIINQNTYNDFNGSELKYQTTFGNTYGFSVGYDFNKPIGIQAEYLVNSIQGQHYKDVLNKMNVERKVDFTYTHMPVLIKFKRIMGSSMLRTVVNRNIIIGFQASRLESAMLDVNGNKTDVRERFKPYDASILFGWEYSLSLKGRLNFSLALRGSFSVIDINEKDWKVDSKYKFSHNMLLGLQGKIYYVLKPFERPHYSHLVF